MIKKAIGFLMNNPISFTILNLLVCCFYAVIIGISLIPSVILMIFASKTFLININGLPSLINIALFAVCIGLSFYAFLITGLFVSGVVQRLLVTGFKEGKYSTDSPLFSRWLVYSGLHIIVLNAILPFMSGSPFTKMYYKILGCKIGKNVFINTVGLHDAYLLEIGDNVVIGGKADISCHIFEGGHLTLGRIKIGNNVLIGTEAYLMPGVTIEEHCNIGMYSYVRKNKTIPKGSMIMAMPGLPAKQIAKIEKDSRD
ncbi:MAG: hypothetical protein ACM3UU_09100 [Ignavibacteriales bacterium]